MSVYSYNSDTQIQQDVDVLEEVAPEFSYRLVVYNDDVNTFEWVIESLMVVCNHTLEQATQCSMFIHFKGKYAVQHGDELKLIPMNDALHDRGISAAIESSN